jgi:hypothetical protein
MTFFSIVTEVCKVSFGILIAVICLKAACNMLLELKRVFFPIPFDPTKPATYRTKPNYVRAFQNTTGNWIVTESKEDGQDHHFTVLKDVFPTIYEIAEEDDE